MNGVHALICSYNNMHIIDKAKKSYIIINSNYNTIVLSTDEFHYIGCMVNMYGYSHVLLCFVSILNIALIGISYSAIITIHDRQYFQHPFLK